MGQLYLYHYHYHYYFGQQNHLQHQTILLDVAAWLEVDMPPVAYMISTKSLPVLGIFIGDRRLAIMPGMSTVVERMERLWEMNVVVGASSLVREGLLREEKDFHRAVMRGWLKSTSKRLIDRQVMSARC